MGTDSYRIGKQGEDVAEIYFTGIGFDIVKRNYRTRYGEIDLIVRKNKSCRFVEVKTYKQDNELKALEKIKRQKKSIIKSAAYFLKSKESYNLEEFQIDAVLICNSNVIKHLENIFFL